MIKVLGLLQNLWVRDPERAREILARHDLDFRAHFLGKLLFMGSLSGKRIRAAFGDELARSIIWEEASLEISSAPSARPLADREHVRSVLAHHRPEVVVAFGIIAHEAVRGLFRGPVILSAHPAARGGRAEHGLRTAALALERMAFERGRAASGREIG